MKAIITVAALLLGLSGCSLLPCDEAAKPPAGNTMETDSAAAAAPPEAPAEVLPAIVPSADGTVTCRSGSDVRMTSIQHTDGGGCRLLYEHDGKRRVIVEHKTGPGDDYCQQAQQRFTMNLIRSGFSCE